MYHFCNAHVCKLLPFYVCHTGQCAHMWFTLVCSLCAQTIMQDIYAASIKAAKEYSTNLQAGANIAGFLKIADAMAAQGVY